MLTKPFSRLLALYLTVALCMLSLPAPGWAMFIPSGRPADQRASDLSRVQAILESSVIKQRLMDYGLPSEAAAAKLNMLSNEQIHNLASRLDSVQAGGDVVGEVIFLLLVAIVVVVVLEATGHHVIIKR